MALVLYLLTVPNFAIADHGDYHGYCEDGVPVVVYWPAKYDDRWIPACFAGIFAPKRIDAMPGAELVIKEDPPDLGRWATVYLNDVRMINPYRDVFPYVVKSTGRTLVPIRMVTEAMGGEALWDEATRKVTIRLGDRYMEMTIDDPNAVANGKTVVLDQPPAIWKARTMVPLRVIAEAFGAEVSWIPEGSRVEIVLEGVTCHPGYCRSF